MHLDSYKSVLCQLNLEEAVTHLFLECPFAKNSWNLFNIVFGANSSFPEVLPQIRSQINSQFFMILAILLCGAIWMARNDCIFKNMPPSINAVKEVFLKELKLLTVRAITKDAACLIYGSKTCCNFSCFFDFFLSFFVFVFVFELVFVLIYNKIFCRGANRPPFCKKKMLTRSVTTSVHSKLPRNRPERTILVSPPSPAVYRLPISVTLMTGMFHRQHHAPAVYRLPSCTDLCDSLTGMWSRQLQQLKRSYAGDGLTGMP
jgi:hypothetical protein